MYLGTVGSIRTMNDPAISIVVPTYKRKALLPRALDSIVAQTFDDWEIILVDDGSTDGTDALATDYARRLGERFVYIRKERSGCCGARNRGIDASRGRFVAFLDSDDEFLPTKLERQLALFRRRPELGFVYSDFAFIDLDGVHHDSAFDTKCPLGRAVAFKTVGPGLCVCTGSLFDGLLRDYFIATIVGMVRREVLGETIRFCADPSYAAEWLFYLKIARACPAGFVDEPLSLHHFVVGSATRTSIHRNLTRMLESRQALATSFDDLNAQQRRLVRHHLAVAYRRIGYDRHHAGAYGPALRYLASVCRIEPNPRAVFDFVQTLFHWLTSAVRTTAAPSHAR